MDDRGWTLNSLRQYVLTIAGLLVAGAMFLHRERDRRYDQRFQDNEKAVSAALIAADKADRSNIEVAKGLLDKIDVLISGAATGVGGTAGSAAVRAHYLAIGALLVSATAVVVLIVFHT